MNELKTRHPTPAELTAFGQGQLEPPRQAEIERHVADCSSCVEALRRVPEDTLVVRLRAAQTSAETPAGDGRGRRVAADTIAMAPPTARTDVPDELASHPKYHVIRKLGNGGMGVVYQAEHTLMERMVALKVIHRQLMSNPSAVERFRQEVKAAAKLSHPNIVTAHDAEQAGDVHFLVMEYVDGVSLAWLVEKRGPLSAAHACHYARQAALGLQHAHEMGMVHRDVKPHNLMPTRKGQIKILDFGLARLARDQEVAGGPRLTGAGAIMGTPDYIAPEQTYDSRHADIRADIYSLGCTLYFLVTGRPPFPVGSATQKLDMHCNRDPQPIQQVRPDVPDELVPVIERMLAKDPEHRYQTPAQVAQALAPLAKAKPEPTEAAAATMVPGRRPRPADTLVVPHTDPEPANDTWKRIGRPLALAGVLLLAVGGITWLAVALLGGDGTPNDPGGRDKLGPGAQATKRVLYVLAPKYYHSRDYEPVRRALEQAGIQVKVASTVRGELLPDAAGGPRANADLTLDEVNLAEFDALLICGGGGNMVFDKVQANKDNLKRLIRGMLDADKTVGALCSGPTLLAANGFLRDVPATAYTIKLEVKQAMEVGGARLREDLPVVEAGNIITSRDPEAAAEFSEKLIRRLQRKRK